jgi:hypothetical protein
MENKIKQLTLLEKLNAITEELGSLKKSGTNEHQKYKYVKGEVAMSEFRLLEVKHRIKVLSSVDNSTLTITKTDKGSFLITGVVVYTIHDLDSKETYTVNVPAAGYDSTDKSIYKLLTGAFKYFILQTFSASTDDPEETPKEVAVSTTISKSRFAFKTKPTVSVTTTTAHNQEPVETKAASVTTDVTEQAAEPTVEAKQPLVVTKTTVTKPMFKSKIFNKSATNGTGATNG